LTWQLLNSDLAASFREFAAIGKALDPEKVQHYRNQLAATGATPHRPRRSTSTERQIAATDRPSSSRRCRLIGGSTGPTEVVLQLFTGTAAFLQVTVINDGHNWPTPTTRGNPPVADHSNATSAIIGFWRQHAGLP
jgi:poly(3-hydroxybutyrate) depolymerase